MKQERIKELRQKCGYTQEELSSLVNIGSRQIWRYENGETSPDSETLLLIAKALATSSDYLLGLTDDPKPYGHNSLSAQEEKIISAFRRGEKFEAIKEIVNAG